MTEINREAYRLGEQTIDTVYFGGGTPSLLSPEELGQLMEKIVRNFKVSADAEITLEANPDDLNSENIQHWKQSGINRLSIGVQSFQEEDLRWMNRAHTVAQAMEGIELAQREGFLNITIDLIYGVPTLSDNDWMRNLDKARALNIPHLSCYALTVEPKTVLGHKVQTQEILDIDPGHQARQFQLLMDWARAFGWEHYEISNFAKPGWRSRHNSAYWKGLPYLGLGPGAHSYDGIQRRWNIANNALYVAGLEKGIPVSEAETLTRENRFNEYIMTALRTLEGIQLSKVREYNGNDYANYLLNGVAKYIALEQVLVLDDAIRLTDTGKLFADGIASELFVDKGSMAETGNEKGAKTL